MVFSDSQRGLFWPFTILQTILQICYMLSFYIACKTAYS